MLDDADAECCGILVLVLVLVLLRPCPTGTADGYLGMLDGALMGA